MSDPQREDFKKAASQTQGGITRELWGFLRDNKKWWLLPLLVAALILGVFIFLSGTGLAPFIYTLF